MKRKVFRTRVVLIVASVMLMMAIIYTSVARYDMRTTHAAQPHTADKQAPQQQAAVVTNRQTVHSAQREVDSEEDLIEILGGVTAGAEDTDTVKKSAEVVAGSQGDEKGQGGGDNFVDFDPSTMSSDQIQTFDGWPRFSKNYFPGPIHASPFKPDYRIRWDYNTSELLQRPDVKSQHPKIITWMVKTRFLPPLPEPVRMRFCPEMPCRMTTNQAYRNVSAALIWAGQLLQGRAPPKRSHPDQVFVYHNHERQDGWTLTSSVRNRAWQSAINWTMHYRLDSDLVDLYGLVVKKNSPSQRNYTDVLAKKTSLVAWIVSHCSTVGKREQYVELMRRYLPVDAYGECSNKRCPRHKDDACFQMVNQTYKFYLAFENALCKDYVTEKFFRYYEADVVVVSRGSDDYKNHSPPGTFINTNDFKSVKELTDHLLYLDSHPEEYIKILEAKNQYRPVYEDYPIRNKRGEITYMHYHYEGIPFCEMCRRLWNLDSYRKHIPHFTAWLDKGNCYKPTDLL